MFHDGETLHALIDGEIRCKHNVVVSVTKFFETRVLSEGRLQVRCYSYRYNASIKGKQNLLRYDNNDDFDDYHRHTFDRQTGEEIRRESMDRNTFPVLSEVLDELENMFE